MQKIDVEGRWKRKRKIDAVADTKQINQKEKQRKRKK